MLIVTNGKIVTEHMILDSRDLLIRDELIVAIVPSGTVEAGPDDEIRKRSSCRFSLPAPARTPLT